MSSKTTATPLPLPDAQRLYDEQDMQALVDALPIPASVIRNGLIRFANGPFFEMAGSSPESIIGVHFAQFVPPEERDRARAGYLEREKKGFKDEGEAKVARFIVATANGGRVIVRPYMRGLAAKDGGVPWYLCVSAVWEEEQPALDFSMALASVAAGLVGQQTEEGVRGALVAGFRTAGLTAEFLQEEGGSFRAPTDLPPEISEAARRALAEHHAIFAGGDRRMPGFVVVPVDVHARRVLFIKGAGLTVAAVPHLGVFARLYTEAVANTRALRAAARQSAELKALAELSRLASDPHPGTLDEFLSRIIQMLGASAGVLRGPDDRILAQVALPLAVGAPWAESLAASLGQRATFRLTTRGNSFLGTLDLFGEAPFTEQALLSLEMLASLLVSVLEHRRLREAWKGQLAETRLLLDLARTTSGTLDTSSILDVACDFLVKLLDASNSSIFLLEPDGVTLRGAAGSALHRESIRSVRLSMDGVSLAARAARERIPVKVEDVQADPSQADPRLVSRYNARALLALPLISRDELIGAVVIADSRGPRPFSGQSVELAQATIGQLALSIANARLYESLWRSYAELAATRAEMVKRERLAALGELSAVVAHEVRNPLGAIFNAVASLKRLLGMDLRRPSAMEDATMLLEVLAEESERLDGMVGDLLDFTRSRELLLLHEPVAPLIQECLEAALHQPGISVGPVEFVTEFESELPSVPMDRKLIRQALVNITVNALQAMPRGGRVWVRAERERRELGDVLRIDIADEGPGIPAELLPRVFEPFFTTKAKGTGLGLAVVKRIVEEHRGEVSMAAGILGRGAKGTTFTMLLPVDAQAWMGSLRRVIGGKG